MIWVLDTSALHSKPLLRNLVRLRLWQAPVQDTVRPILPSIAYTERLRQIRRDGKDETHWRRILRLAGIHIEPFGQQEAELLDDQAQDDAHWRAYARDHLIRCHVQDNRILVSDDQGEAFQDLGPLRTRHAAQALEELII